jgi:hypothetical protein
MKQGLAVVSKLAFLFCCTLLPFLLIQLQEVPDKDPFYRKLTQPADHFVAGDSRAFRGVAPTVIKSALELEGTFLNLAFTGVHSPYGPYYNRFLKRKLARGNAESLFILVVSPSSLMDFKLAKAPRESDFRVYDLYFVNMDPNLEYLLRSANMEEPLLNVLLDKGKGRGEVSKTKEDGWGIRIDPPRLLAPEEIGPAFKKRSERNALVPSPEREAAFELLVRELQEKGEVVIVRMPLPGQVWAYEQTFAPFLDPFLERIAGQANVHYLNYAPLGDEYTYHDGLHHLDKKSAIRFSEKLAYDLKATGLGSN